MKQWTCGDGGYGWKQWKCGGVVVVMGNNRNVVVVVLMVGNNRNLVVVVLCSFINYKRKD